jgi:hypothetical protein
VVTDVWWLPAVLAPYWVDNEIYYVGPNTSLDSWMRHAAEHDVERFSFATELVVDPAQVAQPPWVGDGTASVFNLQIGRFRRDSAPPP